EGMGRDRDRARDRRDALTSVPAVRPLVPDDFEAVRRLWAATEGLGRGPGDSVEGLHRFVARNPGLLSWRWMARRSWARSSAATTGGADSSITWPSPE